MTRVLLYGLAAILALPSLLSAQVPLIPSEKAPYRQRFDLQAQDAQLLLVPQAPATYGEGPFHFRFEHPALQALMETGPTTAYLSAREGGFLLQVLHLRARSVAQEVFGPQPFVIRNGSGEAVGTGTLLVVGRAPEAVDLLGEDGSRVFEVNRDSPVRLVLRTHGNYDDEVQALNTRDFDLRDLRVESDSAGVLTLAGLLRPLRQEATELRLSVETRDGRQVEVAFPGITVRAPAPRRVRIAGGPIYLDAAGRGSARIRVRDFGAELVRFADLLGDANGEVTVLEQRFDPEARVLDAQVEFVARNARQPGSREVRDLQVRSGAQTFRGFVEVVAAPVVAAVRTEGQSRPVLSIGGGVSILRLTGQNLDALRLDCASLGAAECRTVSATPTELVAEVAARPPTREGEHLLHLVGEGPRRTADAAPLATVRVHAEYPSIPMPLAAASFLRIQCEQPRACQANGDAVRVRDDAAASLRLVFDEADLPAEHGWQKLVVTVIRVRGENRQTVRTFGTAAAPRMVRQGSPAGELLLLDAGADPRHGDLFLVRVEHAAEQYAPEHRVAVASADAQVHRIYIDGGPTKRIAGDIAVQPVLFGLGGSEEGSGPDVLYPNAGFGVTWQFLNERLEPRLFSTKLQFLVTNLQAVKGGGGAGGQPALFLSGNLRIPGTDPNRPLTLTTGVARMLGDEGGWRVLAGAGMDLGVARMIFGQ
ncbi:MAG: hypothetical protein H0X65_07510 [Gemmatimonadetes bacterium]|nr:hypothetical protein [Gemmatimonadota bacterium]